ncbi:MAG: hypothetical protein Q4D89_01555 [Arachnia propionica]|uniref:hypothetical protein n=1 Tax=Arachnia propionica TaxID=1750 RepID=UPI0026F9B24A|nr:hypothetical protein [Arachnia propionica]
MTDSGNERPRRAFAPEGAEPDGLDDTRRAVPGGARRGAADDFDTPFARPADPDSATAIPAPVLPETERRLDPPAAVGRRSVSSAPDAPRRSAPSTTSPTTATMSFPSRARLEESGEGDGGWFHHHRRTLLLWGSGALAALVLIVIGFFVLANRGRGDEAQQPGESTTSELPPAASTANLMEASDASNIVPDVSWSQVTTSELKKDHQYRVVCRGKDVADINPVVSLQRTLGADDAERQPALLHEIDGYASVDAATQVYAKRVSDISTCAINQLYIAGATAVTGLGDEAVQVTVVSEEENSLHHTLLMVRTGRTVSTFVVKQTGAAVDPAPLARAAAVRLQEICAASEGTCPGEPTVTPSVPPRVEPPGWLISADLPRITPGSGKWVQGGAPADVKANGIGCENMSLDTDPGPTERQQITFVLSETNQVPAGFGLDELRFTFADEEAASGFESTLVSNILSCKERLTTANVTEFEAVSGTGANEVPVTARMFSVSLDKSDDSKAHYQLVITRAANTVSYVLVAVAPEYQFSEAQLGSVAIRAAQRATQA